MNLSFSSKRRVVSFVAVLFAFNLMMVFAIPGNLQRYQRLANEVTMPAFFQVGFLSTGYFDWRGIVDRDLGILSKPASEVVRRTRSDLHLWIRDGCDCGFGFTSRDLAVCEIVRIHQDGSNGGIHVRGARRDR